MIREGIPRGIAWLKEQVRRAQELSGFRGEFRWNRTGRVW